MHAAPQAPRSPLLIVWEMTDEKADVLAATCRALEAGGAAEAERVLAEGYPFRPEPIVRRQYGPIQATRVFARDGFVDRYTGHRVVFPPVLRALSYALPQAFPFHPAWKTDVMHSAYWEIGATIDHLVPVTRGGTDTESNWMTASMASNSAKMNWTLEELGWTLHPPGDLEIWDGLLGWFLRERSTRAAVQRVHTAVAPCRNRDHSCTCGRTVKAW